MALNRIDKDLPEKLGPILPARDIFDAIIRKLDYEKKESASNIESKWLEFAMRDQDFFAQCLASGSVRSRATLVSLARSSDPLAVPNEFGEDPWYIAIRSATGPISIEGLLFVAAYLFSRALGRQSKNAAELLVISFDDLHTAALNSALTDEVIGLLHHRLPDGGWWNWDMGRRLREAVVDAFAERLLAPSRFIQLTDREDLMEQLIEMARWRGNGYRYTKELHSLVSPKRYSGSGLRLSEIWQSHTVSH